jgi:hypothetical protein
VLAPRELLQWWLRQSVANALGNAILVYGEADVVEQMIGSSLFTSDMLRSCTIAE